MYLTMEKIKLLIAIPTTDGIHPELSARLFYWAKQYDKGVVNLHIVTKVQPVDRARNKLVDFFLSKDFTHILFIDADTVPEPDAISKLLSHDKEVVTGLTPMLMYDDKKKAWNTMYNVFKPKIKDNYTEVVNLTGKLEKADKCGASCLLIKREVFEKMKKPYFRFILSDDGLNHKQSEDLFFTENLKDIGVQLYCDTSVICGHYKTIKLG